MRAFLGTACPACGHPGPYVRIPASGDVTCGSCLAELEVHHVGTGDGPFRQFPNELVETPVHAPSPVIDNSSAESRSWWLLRPPLAKAVTIVARGGRLRRLLHHGVRILRDLDA